MNLFLGIRMAFAGGRESLARMSLMAIGIAVGVPLILIALGGLPIMQSHIDRLAWHRTSAQSPQTAPDPALWIAVTDRYAGRDIVRVHIAPLGPRPPIPPGVEKLPGPGEKLISPALAELLRTVPDDQLGNRYPGRVVGTIGPDGLVMPGELVAIIGHSPEQMRAMHGAVEIWGIEQPGEPVDFAEVLGVFFGLLAAVLVAPVVLFVGMTTRIGGVRAEMRFAAIRLAGATRLQTAVFTTTETAIAAITGSVLGFIAFYAIRPVVASQVTLGHGMPIFAEDIAVPLSSQLVILIGIPLLAVLTTLVALRPAQMTPMGVRRRWRRPPPRAWRLVPVGLGLAGTWYASNADPNSQVVAQIAALSSITLLVGFFLAGAWVCFWISRGMARVSRRATALIVARRIAADPYATFRAVSGAAIGIFLTAQLGFALALYESGQLRVSDEPLGSTLDAGVVAVHVRGVAQDSLTPLLSEGVVIARDGGGGRIFVACADLARVTDLDCPLPAYPDEGQDNPRFFQLEDLFSLPYPNPSAADFIYQPTGFAEPGAVHERLPIQTLFIPTDGTAAAQERIRTLAASQVPNSRSKVRDDLVPRQDDFSAIATTMPYVIVFILLFTACALAVSVIGGILERKRPFALLRATGVRQSELRRIVILETGVPLVITVVLGIGLAAVQALGTVPPDKWVLPSPAFFAGLGAGLVAAFLVSLIAVPFMDIATRFDTIRYE